MPLRLIREPVLSWLPRCWVTGIKHLAQLLTSSKKRWHTIIFFFFKQAQYSPKQIFFSTLWPIHSFVTVQCKAVWHLFQIRFSPHFYVCPLVPSSVLKFKSRHDLFHPDPFLCCRTIKSIFTALFCRSLLEAFVFLAFLSVTFGPKSGKVWGSLSLACQWLTHLSFKERAQHVGSLREACRFSVHSLRSFSTVSRLLHRQSLDNHSLHSKGIWIL